MNVDTSSARLKNHLGNAFGSLIFPLGFLVGKMSGFLLLTIGSLLFGDLDGSAFFFFESLLSGLVGGFFVGLIFIRVIPDVRLFSAMLIPFFGVVIFSSDALSQGLTETSAFQVLFSVVTLVTFYLILRNRQRWLGTMVPIPAPYSYSDGKYTPMSQKEVDAFEIDSHAIIDALNNFEKERQKKKDSSLRRILLAVDGSSGSWRSSTLEKDAYHYFYTIDNHKDLNCLRFALPSGISEKNLIEAYKREKFFRSWIEEQGINYDLDYTGQGFLR